jgi:hypothetical protein
MALPLIATAVSPMVNGLFSLIDDLFTSDEERDAAKLRVLELEKSGELAQIAVNMKEAENPSVFVAGWRPFIGWTCGLAFCWTFLLHPIAVFAAVALRVDLPLHLLPQMDLSAMMPVLMGMLGLGAMRSWEKSKGVARDAPIGQSTLDRRAK